MGETVVGASPLKYVPGLGLYHHLYILYTNDAGQSFVLRGGPGGSGPSSPAAQLPEASSGWGGGSYGNIHGIKAEYRIVNGVPPPDWNDGSHTYTGPVATGSDADLQPKIVAMLQRINEINLGEIPFLVI